MAYLFTALCTLLVCLLARRVIGRFHSKSLKLSSEGFEGDGFGYDVDASENFMIIGCPNDIVNGKRDTGSAIIYAFNAGTVGQGYKIVPPNQKIDRYFGRSVAISNDRVIVGSRYTNHTGQLTGSAYVYKRNNELWMLESRLVPRDGTAHDGFGYDVDIYEDYAVVGSFKDDDKGWNSGSAYVFKYDGRVWRHQAKLTSNDGAAWDLFGYSVSIFKENIVIGAISHDSNTVKNSGAAYVFAKNQSTSQWRVETKLEPPVPRVQGFFGCSVDLHDNRLAVGAYGEDGESGSVYVYKRSPRGWIKDGRFTASDKMKGNHFGWSVSTDGNSIVVGSRDSGDKDLDSGAAYIYLTKNEVPEERKLLAYNKMDDRWFGRSVSVHNGRVVVGSYSEKLNNNGSVYVFDIIDVEEPTVLTWVLGIVIPTVIIILAGLLVFKFRVRLSNVRLPTACLAKDRSKSSDEIVQTSEEHMLKPVSVRT